MRMFSVVLIVLCIIIPVFTTSAASMLFFGDARQYSRAGKTASGELFVSGALTAAHKNLPFGSLVKVVNLENDKYVTVRINDRLSAQAGGVLNVTRAAAVLLGFRGSGGSKVEVQVVKIPSATASSGLNTVQKKDPPPVKKTSFGKDSSPVSPGFGVQGAGRFRVQVGAFRKRENASLFAGKLRSRGYAVTFSKCSNGFFRVLVGPYATRSAAAAVQSVLSTDAPGAFVRKG